MCKKLVLLMIVLVICMSASAIAADVFVSEIKVELRTRGAKSAGRATIEIMNDSGQLVTSGTVSAQWSGTATNSTTTNLGSSGTARSDSTFSDAGGLYTITITDVSASGYTYNPSLNAVTVTYITPDMISYSWAGLDREYYLHVPVGQPTNGMPLVFVLHGWAQDEIFGTMNFTNMPALGDKYGFAVVYPQAYGSGSGTGAPGWTAGYPDDGPGDDVGFLSSLAQDLQSQYGFSSDYTFTSGFSNGGDMSYRLACEASDIFAGAAPVAGCMVTPIYENCNPSNPVSLIETHGTSDNTTKYDGDPDWDGMGYYGAIDGTNLWASLNGCTDTTVESLYGGAVEATKHTGGSNGSEVWLYTVIGGGHSWPSNNPETSEEIWAFFEQTVIVGGSVCGDGSCDPGEDECNCSADCGAPPSTETVCDDGLDDDCDGDVDCDDADCDGVGGCPSCGDATCDSGLGEDQCNCAADCGTPPSTETNCDDGDDEDCDGDVDCADTDCAADPVCNLTWVKVDDRDPACSYVDFGQYEGNPGYLETESYSEIVGATATFSFTGTRARYYGFLRNDLGYADIYVDGGYETTIDCYGSTQYDVLLYETQGLSDSAHTLEVVVNGGSNPSSSGIEVIVDAFEYVNTSGSFCGDGVCDPGEDCNSCADCDGRQSGPPSNRYCCGNGVVESAEGDGTICDGNY